MSLIPKLDDGLVGKDLNLSFRYEGFFRFNIPYTLYSLSI